jgi:hypothetical protein
MANTKKMDRAARKKTKRDARRGVKAQLAALSYAERKAMRKHEGTRSEFLRELEQSKQPAAE